MKRYLLSSAGVFSLVVFLGCDNNAPSNKTPLHSSAEVMVLTSANWRAEVEQSKVPVLVDFWAPWCGPCMKFSPTVEKIAGDFKGKIKVGKVNVDDAPQLASTYKIDGIPCVMLFKGGKEPVESFVGVTSEAKLVRSINSLLAQR